MTTRCAWADGHPLLTAYHDSEWGVLNRDRRHLFELLVLEGMQAGLSWLSVLSRRDAYRDAFEGFAPEQIAGWPLAVVERLMTNPGLIRNRAKLLSVLHNARAFLAIEEEWGGFDQYLDQVTGGPVIHHFAPGDPIPSQDETSRQLSDGLRRRGFSFVGPVICYSFLESAGWAVDHVSNCFRYSG